MSDQFFYRYDCPNGAVTQAIREVNTLMLWNRPHLSLYIDTVMQHLQESGLSAVEANRRVSKLLSFETSVTDHRII